MYSIYIYIYIHIHTHLYLHENLVLVQCDEHAERGRCEFVIEQRVGGTVAGEDLGMCVRIHYVHMYVCVCKFVIEQRVGGTVAGEDLGMCVRIYYVHMYVLSYVLSPLTRF